MRRWWILVGLAGCRQVFGIDQPGAIADAPRTTTPIDGHRDSATDNGMLPGLAMYVEPGIALWSNDQPPDVAWALTDDTFAMADVWNGDGPTAASLLFDGVDGTKPFSVWMEGQVYAPQGFQELEVTANDYAFFDAELIPNSGSFEHVVTCKKNLTQMKTISVPSAGWYRVRGGWSSSGDAPEFSVLHAGPQDPSIESYDDATLRH